MSEGISVPRFLNMTYEMGVKTSDMLHRAMTAFIHTNAPSAVRIISDDDMIDAMYNNLYSEVMEFVIRDAHNIERVNYLLWVAHNLERAADRVTNICERTIYVETGELGDMHILQSPPAKIKNGYMQIIAAIDVGSNAMRMVVGRIVYDGKVEAVENLRLPVRLGQDAFTDGHPQRGNRTASPGCVCPLSQDRGRP